MSKYRRERSQKHKDYMKVYRKKHYAMRKARLDELKAGGCVLCGYNLHPSALDFHHKEPGTKKWKSQQLMNRNWDDVLEEVQKCILLCANCHRIIHAELKVP